MKMREEMQPLLLPWRLGALGGLASWRREVPKRKRPPRGGAAFDLKPSGVAKPLAAEFEVSQAGAGFAAFEAAAEAALFGALLALLLALLLLGRPLGALQGQADLPLVAVHAEDLDLQVLADLERLLRLLDLLVADLADVQQAFEPRLQLDEHAEVGDLRHRPVHDHAGAVVLRDHRHPRVFLHLLEA